MESNLYTRVKKVRKLGVTFLGALLYCSMIYGASDSSMLQMLARAIANSNNENVQISLMKGMLKSMEGRRGVDAPESWVDVRANLSSSDNREAKRLLQELSQIFGDEDAAFEALNTLRNQSANAGEREGALRSLLAQRNDALAIELETLLDDR